MKILRIVWRVSLFLIVLEFLFRGSGWATVAWQDLQNKHRLSAAGSYRILCLGDSLTYDGGSDGYPVQLEQILNTRLGSGKVKVINRSIPGGNSTETLDQLPAWLDEYRPQMVIAMMGLSDESYFVPRAQESSLKFFNRRLSGLKVYQVSSKLLSNSYEYAHDKYGLGPARVAKHEVIDNASLETGEEIPAWFSKMLVYASLAEGKKDYAAAERIYQRLSSASVSPQLQARMRRKLGDTLRQGQKFAEYADVLQEILTINPGDFWAMTWVWKDCRDPNFVKEVLPVLQKLSAQRPDVPYFEELLGACTQEMGLTDEAKSHFDRARALRENGLNPLTKKNYLKLLDQLESRKIQPVIMQYPRRPVDEFKSMLKAYPDLDTVIFVDNERIFEEALLRGKYNDIFKDRAGGNFGHMTKAGHTILANHLADSIFRLLR